MLEVEPLAFESLGVRSMATLVETDDLKVLIDPAVALGPRRYGLVPHPKEERRRLDLWSRVRARAAEADVLVVTHYHYDHHNPAEPEVYKDKAVYLKHPLENINKSQRGRAAHFLRRLEGVARSVETADGCEFRRGKTAIRFSQAVCHGTNSRLGYVVETSITCGGETVVHTSDVEGPALDEQAAFVIQEDPDVLILDGPMTYMLGYRYPRKCLETSIDNINKIINKTSVRSVVVDHHLTRDLDYKGQIAGISETARDRGANVTTAAEYAGLEVELLEARRRELYGQDEDPGQDRDRDRSQARY